jgi:hypothetical protein
MPATRLFCRPAGSSCWPIKKVVFYTPFLISLELLFYPRQSVLWLLGIIGARKQPLVGANCVMDSKQKRGEGEMAIRDNRGVVKQTMAGFWGPLMTQDDESLKSEFPPPQIPQFNLNEETLLLKSPDCIFNLRHKPSDNTAFLGKTIVTLNFEDILAYPGSNQKTVMTM